MKSQHNAIVLVGVLKNARDLGIVLRERWYRMPFAHAPKQRYDYLAFYQPAVFGKRGQCIRYFAIVKKTRVVTRERLLPDEPTHPRARLPYVRVDLGRIQQLSRPVRNIVPRRVTFGFTTLHRLRTARDILQLFEIAPIEQIMEDALRRAGIPVHPQPTIRIGTNRFRPDFVIEHAKGPIAIECDNTASHRSATQRRRDQEKDKIMRRAGWKVTRLSEAAILSDLRGCISRVKKTISSR